MLYNLVMWLQEQIPTILAPLRAVQEKGLSFFLFHVVPPRTPAKLKCFAACRGEEEAGEETEGKGEGGCDPQGHLPAKWANVGHRPNIATN
jgi:hypothetical protein